MKLKEIEKTAIIDRMYTLNSNRTKVAKSLGMSLSTLQRRLKTYGIEPGKPVSGELELDIASLSEVSNG